MVDTDIDNTVSDKDTFSCAVCYETVSSRELAKLPCCYNSQSSTKYCKACIIIVCRRASGLGRCPTCCSYIRVEEDRDSGDVKISKADDCEQCRCCSQIRVIAEQERKLCDACLLGITYAFRYECEGCGIWQVIRHPMWRYMETPTSFSTDTWFCGYRCHDQTHWRIHPNDLRYVPVDDRPESWGQQEEWFALIREERRRRGLRLNSNSRQASIFGIDRETLVIFVKSMIVLLLVYYFSDS
mmetsp:Transcript_304/g.336  ORF Transcript_304/g.336 Transcript_304/m.336 type:complete len:241 (+) Transcript_304:273-995(+)